MRRGLLESCGVATLMASVMVILQLTAVPVVSQSPSVTAWGHPNLEGIWLDVYDTPFERAAELGDREFATPEERAARDQARMNQPWAQRALGSCTARRGWRVQRRLHVGQTGGTTHVARRRSANRKDSFADGGGPAAGRSPARVAPHALAKHRDLRD